MPLLFGLRMGVWRARDGKRYIAMGTDNAAGDRRDLLTAADLAEASQPSPEGAGSRCHPHGSLAVAVGAHRTPSAVFDRFSPNGQYAKHPQGASQVSPCSRRHK